MVIEKFTVDNKPYETRLSFDGHEYEIRAYHMDKPANGFSYRVKLEDQQDLKVLAGQDMLKELVRIAKDDIINKRYEGLQEALKAAKR